MKPEKQLYQWDVNQYLTGINPAAQYVDYTIGNEVIRLETEGTRCRIPDEVLQTYGGKTCYERYPDGTYRAYSFTVLYAPKPPDYVYTPEERTTFEALTARVDAAINEIKRRADSGEFTPKKGVDYFTNAEKAEMMESVSSGAVGEFRKVVDSATTEYNRNAAEKLTTYDTNAEQHTTDYNRNAEVKLESYNQNHTEKVAEYNQNAENKMAEFEGQMSEKANIDGYYEEMTVGDAEQLVSTQFVEDNEPYGYRTTGGSADVGNRAYIDKIVGGTVAWNQLVNGAGHADNVTYDGGRFIVSNLSGIGTVVLNDHINLIKGHKYFIEASSELNNCIFYIYTTDYKTAFVNIGGINKDSFSVSHIAECSYTNTYRMYLNRYGATEDTPTANYDGYFQLFDLTQMFGSTIADYIYSLEQSQAGAGVAWFKKLFPKDYYEYNAGELLSVEGLNSHDTVGFNQWDEALERGGLYIETGLPFDDTRWFRTKNFIPIFPSTAYYHKIPTRAMYGRFYFYDVDKNLVSYTGTSAVMNTIFTTPQNAHYMKFVLAKVDYGTTYNHDICINLSNPSRNGEYEPYEKHSYPLDSSLTLRGIPKLDASNNLYYDGDEYASDGKVKRKYGVVDLGTLNWEATTSYQSIFLAKPWADLKAKSSNLFTAPYGVAGIGGWGAMPDKSIYVNANTGNVSIKDSAYTNVTAFKAAMSGVMLVYELATPTTETAEPYNEIQICDDFGTEEFVSTGIVPVGHKTRYPANLRDKLQHLPSLASADGTYLIQQTGKQMSLIHMPAVFPDTPTEDGTYTLETVVTGGVATLQWVAK